MRVAYEDVRFAPRSLLTAELMDCSLETELYGTSPELEKEHNKIAINTAGPRGRSDRAATLTTPSIETTSASAHEHDALLSKRYTATDGGVEISVFAHSMAIRIAVMKL